MTNTVDYLFKWKKDTRQLSVEVKNKSNKYVKNWQYTDVMYSFYGIYTIGLLVYYPEVFENTNCTIKLKNTNQNLYEHIINNYATYTKLNELKELKNFIEVYDTVGNVIPVWPGENEHRGYKSKCLDLPDIYFKRHTKWTQNLINEYPEAMIEDLHKSPYPEKMKDFLSFIKRDDEYKNFLVNITEKIKLRTKKLNM